MALGPLGDFDAKGAFFAFPHETGYLRTMGGYGFTDEEVDWYAVVPLSVPSPMGEAYLCGLCAVVGIWTTHPLRGVQTPEIWRPVGSSVIALSDRQQVILRLVEMGKSNASIALSLGYSSSTVKAEIQKALRALKVNDRVAAAKRARDLGLLEDEAPVSLSVLIA
jgi:DNA-binding CsgD family transcriptional regulator